MMKKLNKPIKRSVSSKKDKDNLKILFDTFDEN